MKTRLPSLLNQLINLQSKLYNYQSHLEHKNKNDIAQLVGKSGFELDESINKIITAILLINKQNEHK